MYISFGARTNKWFVMLFCNPGSPETNKFIVVLSASAWLAMFTYVSNVLNPWLPICGRISLLAFHKLSL